MNTPTQQELHRERLAAGDPAESAHDHVVAALAERRPILPRHRLWLSHGGPSDLVAEAREQGVRV